MCRYIICPQNHKTVRRCQNTDSCGGPQNDGNPVSDSKTPCLACGNYILPKSQTEILEKERERMLEKKSIKLLKREAQAAVDEKHGDLDYAQKEALVEKKWKEACKARETKKRLLLQRLEKPECELSKKEVRKNGNMKCQDRVLARDLVEKEGGTVEEHLKSIEQNRLIKLRRELEKLGRNFKAKEEPSSPGIESSRMGASRPRVHPSAPQFQPPHDPGNLDRDERRVYSPRPHRSSPAPSPPSGLMPQNIAAGQTHSRQASTSSQQSSIPIRSRNPTPTSGGQGTSLSPLRKPAPKRTRTGDQAIGSKSASPATSMPHSPAISRAQSPASLHMQSPLGSGSRSPGPSRPQSRAGSAGDYYDSKSDASSDFKAFVATGERANRARPGPGPSPQPSSHSSSRTSSGVSTGAFNDFLKSPSGSRTSSPLGSRSASPSASPSAAHAGSPKPPTTATTSKTQTAPKKPSTSTTTASSSCSSGPGSAFLSGSTAGTARPRPANVSSGATRSSSSRSSSPSVNRATRAGTTPPPSYVGKGKGKAPQK